ncbi:hypothetical protein F0U62_12555 [Cystobacter fuscus]|uniref:hypothetical protein n=1 Tax=Cystobacter fuscus TaxID=43 RepID=UPI002B2B5E23|nr:hypothetical protein F0U62_12555 [Cystobacter fuscus]
MEQKPFSFENYALAIKGTCTAAGIPPFTLGRFRHSVTNLVPDGAFVQREGGVHFEPLPPPTQDEVERLLREVRHRVLCLLENRRALPAQGPEDALQAYWAHSLQQRLRWTEVDVRPPPRKQPRCTFLEGFSLHANTHLPANDRQGLEQLCRYGARGALALERLLTSGGRPHHLPNEAPTAGRHHAPALEHLERPTRPAQRAPTQGPAQLAWC